jgi:hypothetical protein
LGAVPIKAGRNSGSVAFGDDDGEGEAGFGVCDEVTSTPSSKPIMQRIPSRMAK